MLSVLGRSDCELFKILPAENAPDEASRLQAGHCFEVNVVASISVDSEKFLDKMAPYHVTNNWYEVDLPNILSLWLRCLDEPLESQPAQDIVQEEEEQETTSQEGELPGCLCYCTAADAPLATNIRKSLIDNLGKENTKEVLSTLVSKTVKRNNVMSRVFFHQGEPVKLQI